MFEKMKAKKRAAELKGRIAELEQKRSRSQAALVEAILTHQSPNDSDVDYFNRYTTEINRLRDEMQKIEKDLNI